MIEEFVKAWELRKGEIEEKYKQAHPKNYKEIVSNVIAILGDASHAWQRISTSILHEIDDGDYQGTLLYLIPESGYQPTDYWYVRVGYGSCSGCDTLESIRSYGDGPPDAHQVAAYMTLSLHILQGLKKLDGAVA